jgi:flagella basal body P-ring formation protein FlgA
MGRMNQYRLKFFHFIFQYLAVASMRRIVACCVVSILVTMGSLTAFAQSSQQSNRLPQSNRRTSVVLKSRAFLTSNSITLGQIATVDAGNDAATKWWNDVELELFENSSDLKITRKFVQLGMRLKGAKENSFSITGADTCVVTKVDRKAVQAEFVDQIQLDIARQLNAPAERLKIRLLTSLDQWMAETEILIDEFWVQVTLPESGFYGRQTVEVVVADLAGHSDTLTMNIEMAWVRPVAVVNRSIPAGQEIKADDVQILERQTTQADTSLVSFDQIVGQVANTNIAPYQPLQSSHLGHKKAEVQNQMIKKNEPVIVRSIGNGIVIELKNAKAVTAGAMGEIITVLNMSTQKQIRAKIIGPSLVEIAD